MKFVVKAVVYGFAFNLGAALFKKVAKHIGLGEEQKAAPDPSPHAGHDGHDGHDGGGDSTLQHSYS